MFKLAEKGTIDMRDGLVQETIACADRGDLPALRELLRQDPELAGSSWGYVTPLHFAVRSGHMDAVQLLLEHGADATEKMLGWQDDLVTKAQDRGYAALADLLARHLAERYRTSPEGSSLAELIKSRRKEAVLRELDASEERVHESDERGNTPMHWAVMTRQMWLIDALLERGADIGAKRADGATPLLLALDGDYFYRANRDLSPEVLRNPWFLVGYLIARGAEYDIWTAAALGDTEQVADLLDAEPSLVNAAGATGKRPIGYAAKHGHTVTVRLLLERGADPNAEERGATHGSALWSAVKDNHEAIVKLLLEHGANPNAGVEAGGSPLFIGMRNRHDALVNLLYAHGATVQIDSACCLGRIDLVGEMIHARPELMNNGGDFGPLCMAAGYGHMELVKLLIRSGADLNEPWYCNNFMGYATDAGMDMVRLLLESGANPNLANWLGVTYLHQAAWSGQVAYAQLLLEFGANIHAVDKEYETTPLGWAAKFGQLEMVRFLLEQGADPYPAHVESWTQPLTWAKRKGHEDIAALLLGSTK
ncbi:ankyrin repeat domain-containing protein [Paenibacillus cremeus]|uniref:Ankyrin repeat domain-containing protein n=1 Tax=Paenibacillus cremeus TaxID=2163881 RepID=A0A559KFN7_9BACL|nr:ankyrin repeat domain-containing protein [Paenibacillus cremeus]TVY10943.1 ankyrin repeat domain-containing protein [Paenibacillus cremeus]